MALPKEILRYKVHSFSSFSSLFRPENILVDKPSEQSSRWSSDTNHAPQFLILELERPGIVQEIKFGKFEKSHVCNLKRFKVFCGLVVDDMIEVFDGGLKNDSTAETFTLPFEKDGKYFPSRFIKIMPLQSWGTTFNFSIWHVELQGVQDPRVVKPVLSWYNTCREQKATLLCLKHFRQFNYMEAYEALLQRADVTLEHPLMTQLHTQLVITGNYQGTEEILLKAAEEGLFEDFASQQHYIPKWKLIEPVVKDSVTSRPGMRGGHQMCVDPATETLYLFGGWDGNIDLGDLWSFHVPSNEWQLMSANTQEQGGPSPRSCHKICFDEDRKHIFILGRYLDAAMRTSENLKSDFYMYEVNAAKWTLITEDTAGMGGPSLIFDHQMVVDSERRMIYVFGGRILSESVFLNVNAERIEATFSGLFSYHIPTNTWSKIKDDCPQLKSRIGHSMVYHPVEHNLYIFAGQRSKVFLNDFFCFNVDSHKITYICDGSGRKGETTPASGFTQRANLNPETNEIYILSGFCKEHPRRKVSNSFWVYDITKNQWSCVYNNEENGASAIQEKLLEHPAPRYAHQLLFDPIHKVHYLFGGNSGRDASPRMRLDDFWSLKLLRPQSSDLLRQCLLLVRTHQFKELTASEPVQALQFLQNQLAAVIDHSVSEERDKFHNLASRLFTSTEEDEDMDDYYTNEQPKFQSRTRLYTQLLQLFPAHMTQPKENLMDLVKLN